MITAETYNEIAGQQAERIFRLALAITHSRDDAQDVVQDVFEKLWRRRLFMSEHSARAMLTVMARNRAIDICRRRRVTVEPTDVPDDEPTTDRLPEVLEIIDRLPERARLIVTLRDIECYSFEQVAMLTDTTPEAVRMALSRARATIKNEILKRHNNE